MGIPADDTQYTEDKKVSKYKGEKVAAISLKKMKSFFGEFQGFELNVYPTDKLLDFINSSVEYLDREAAEEDPTYKQIIPYCVFYSDDEQVLTYTRGKSGGESRLHSQIAVGIGGHINPCDCSYLEAVKREIKEEIGIENADVSDLIGFLNDDSTEVGKVHFGLVHLVELESKNVIAKEDCLANLEFKSLDELQGSLYDRLETWSQMVVKNI